MENDNLAKLRELNIEDFIWIVVLGLTILNIFSNYFERLYVVNSDIKDKRKFRSINLTILIVTILITIYFVSRDYGNYVKNDKKEEYLLPLISNVLFLIGGVLLLYSFFRNDNEDEVDIIT